MKFSEPSNFFNNLGESLLLEILARLPSRAAIRLKLVCKSWCSLISSQYFITFFNHRRHDPSLPPIHDPHSSSSGFIFRSVFDSCLSMVRWGYAHHDSNLRGFHRPDLSFLPYPQSTITVKGSCADLILCSTRISESKLNVCNQLTKQWAALPPPPAPKFKSIQIPVIGTGFLCVPAPCSLCNPSTQCVDNSRYNFMVVQILPFLGGLFEYRLDLFFSEEGQWKTLGVSLPRALTVGSRSSGSLVSYKGMLHWLMSGFVFVYDPYNCHERFSRVIDMPAEMIAAEDEEEYHAETIGLFHDRLRVTLTTDIWGVDYFDDPIYYIWELEDYDMGKWSLVHMISPKRCLPLRPLWDLDPDLDPKINIDPKIRETGFYYIDGSAFYWTNSSGWWVGNGIVHWITDPWWPTPVPQLTCTIQNNENTLGNS